ncbi:methylamine utilization protein [Marinomonas algicola]|uniref:methylamine utilization protein n=1 Tax=Marinomonas algicola TaxID=2773454 RepID=UPI0017482F66|nr:methylamine utilization protein [Marinomonas algicola]
MPLINIKRVLTVLSAFCSVSIFAADLTVTVGDLDNQPIQNAVVELYNAKYTMSDTELDKPKEYEVAQKMREFTPFVLAVPVGSSVTFPNYDKTRHHVYSFSAVKTFELKLFSGESHAPVVLDKEGIVALGCNIHDAMQAYIYVTKSRYVAITDEHGQAHFTELPADLFDVKTWHPLQEEAVDSSKITTRDGSLSMDVALSIVDTFDDTESEYAY